MERKILHIAENNFYPNYPLLPCKKAEEIIDEIKANHHSTDIFIISVNYKCKNVNRTDNEGILLLKYLRLSHFQQHCILYSFLSREQLIQQDPKNLIIFSNGVTFVQLPSDLNQLNLNVLTNNKAQNDLSEYFKIGFSTPQENRHDWANWWGIERLWQIHEVVIQKKKEKVPDYIASPFNKKINSLVSLVARYLYPINSDSVREANDKIKIEEFELRKRGLDNLIRSKKTLAQDRDIYKKQIEKIDILISDVKNRKSDSDLITGIRERIIKNDRKIVLLDDQAKDGWEMIFKNMLYNENDRLFSNLIAPEINADKTYLQAINPSTDIVLLDLRLNKEPGTIHDISKLSGVEVLKIIKKRHPGIPVIMITASNKFKSYQTLLDLGADGYWMKEGLDSRFSEQESLENYLSLLKLVDKLSGKEYRLLKHFAIQIKIIKKNGSPWWKSHEWNDCNKTEIALNQTDNDEFTCDVTKLLDYGLMLYTNWLKIFILNENNENTNNEVYKENLLANIINTLGKCVELIHFKVKNKQRRELIARDEIGGVFNANGIDKKRCDFLAFYIYTIRNFGSHVFVNGLITYELFEFFIKILLSWLGSSQYTEIDFNDIGIRHIYDFIKLRNSPTDIIAKCTEMILKRGPQQIYTYDNYASIFLSFDK